MRHMRRMRNAVAIAGVVLATLVGPTAAQAGTFSDSAQSCSGRTSSQPFLRWLDPLRYTLIPRGNFEQGTSGWKLTGGAAIVSGNESFYVSGPGTRSLYLPSGSSATTPAVCIETLDAVARYFAKNRGTVLLSSLAVEVLFEDPLTGKVRALPAGVHTGGSSWHPSLPALAVLDLLAPVLGKNGQIAVAFRFKPVGLGARWQIDDVYVDPFIQR
jgi:hypothetical protein